jgi:hypothetical protein
VSIIVVVVVDDDYDDNNNNNNNNNALYVAFRDVTHRLYPDLIYLPDAIRFHGSRSIELREDL